MIEYLLNGMQWFILDGNKINYMVKVWSVEDSKGKFLWEIQVVYVLIYGLSFGGYTENPITI